MKMISTNITGTNTTGTVLPQRTCLLVLKALLLVLLATTPAAWAQGPVSSKPVSEQLSTELQFDILFPRERPDGAIAQQWADVFAKEGIPLRIRQPLLNDKAGVEQQVWGTIRRVKVTGQLDRSGLIVFPDRKFSLSDTAKLEEWIEELRVYGAQGAPEGQPLWGLERSEFDRLHAVMKQPTAQPTQELGLTEAIRALELSPNFPLRFSAETRKLLTEQPDLSLVKHDLRGFAKGTALALILHQYRLAFAPKRLPDESIVLAVEPFQPEKTMWPIGWNPDDLGLRRGSYASKLYSPQPIRIEQTRMLDLIPQIEEATDLKVFFDPYGLAAAKVNPERLVVNYPQKNTSWSLCLKTILSQVKLSLEVRVDENDKPFLWITRYAPRPARTPR